MATTKSNKSKSSGNEIIIHTTPNTETKRKPRSVERAKKKIKKRESYIEEHEHILSEIQVRSEEQEYMQEYEYLYATTKKLVRKAKLQALETGQTRDYYAFCTLVSQQREIIADIRATSDFSNQVQQLIDNALQPLMSQVGQAIIDNAYHQRRLLVDVCPPKDRKFLENELNRMTQNLGTLLQAKYEWAAQRIQELLIGEPVQPSKKKR